MADKANKAVILLMRTPLCNVKHDMMRRSVGNRGDVQADRWSWIARHLNCVLLAVEFICDVVAHHSVFEDVLRGTSLYSLRLRCWCSFDFLPQNGTTQNSQHGGCSFAVSTAELVTNCSTCNSPHGRTCAAFVGLHGHLLLRTNLSRHGYLLNDLNGRDDFANFLCKRQFTHAQ